MKAEDAAALLEADALLPVKQKVKTRAEIDTISARAYSHPALPDPVVRLTADSLAQGEDLALEFLGFRAPEVTGPIAQRKRQALGFPGWALINDPDHARYALELVKEFRKEVRRAKSKPGHGYDGIQAIAKKLNRSVAHFLPSFWEEAGRAFIEYGNASYASRCFSKAREAEKVHALKVDESIRRSAFLEFALAGCLTIKALTEYSKELQAAYGAEEAWKIFRELIVRRTLGGMPPWAAMAKDVKRIAKAAKLDYEAELKGLLRELIDSPAMSRAEISFWKNCGDVVKTLAHEEPAVAKALLTLMPETSYWASDPIWQWLEMLEDWELLPILYGEGNQEAKPDESAAKWFSKYCQAAGRSRVDQRLHEVLPKLATQLKQDGEAIKPFGKRWGDFSCDVDLVDQALELGVPVADPPGDLALDLDEWAEIVTEDECPEDRPRDPIHLAKDERFGPALKRAVSNFAGNPAFETAAMGKASFIEARREWIMQISSAGSEEALPGAWSAVQRLRNSTSRGTFREFPEAYEVLKKADISKALGNTLRTFVLDEYGWPALEDAIKKLAPESKKGLECYGHFPHVIVTNGLNVIVVERDGPVFECELNVKKNQEVRCLDYYEGDLLVTLYDNSEYESEAYWASNPKKELEASWRYGRAQPNGAVVERPGGGWFNGEQTVSKGDTKKVENGEKFFSDGEHFWVMVYEEGYSKQTLREIDPGNAKKGRKSLPSFLEDFVEDGTAIDFRNSSLAKMGDCVKDSPLGSKDGLIGWRVRDRNEEWARAEGIDGRTVEPPVGPSGAPGPVPLGLLDQPGTKDKLIITGDSGWDSTYRIDIDVWTPDGKQQVAGVGESGTAYYQGQPYMLMPLFWHLFQLRDAATSKKLRKLKDKDAAALIKAARADLDAAADAKGAMQYENLNAIIEKLFPKCDERLARGLQGVIVRAARCKTDLDELIEARDPSVEEEESLADADVESFLDDALRELRVGYSWGQLDKFFACVEQTGKFFAGEVAVDKHPPRVGFWWDQLLGNLEAKAYRAYWSCEDIHESPQKLANAPWCKFLEIWRQCQLTQLPGKLRLLTGKLKKPAPFSLPDEEQETELWRFYEEKNSKYIFHCEDLEEVYEEDTQVIEYTESSKFHTPKNFAISEEQESENVWDGQRLSEFVKLIAEREPPFLNDDQLQRLAEGVGVRVAEAGLLWCGFPNFGEWSKNFLPKPIRERLGLKVAEAAAARQSLKVMDESVQMSLLSAMLDGPPADLWDNPDAAIDRLIAGWSDVVPARLELPPAVMDQLDNLSGWGVEVGDIVTSLADPENAEMFCEGVSSIDKEHSYGLSIENEPSTCFNDGALSVVIGSLPTLYYHLPVGDPARDAAKRAYEIGLKRIKNPNLLFDIGTKHFEEDKKKSLGVDFISQFGKVKKGEKFHELDTGALVGVGDKDTVFLTFRPAKATTAKAKEQVRNAIGLMSDESIYEQASDDFDHVQLLLSDGYKAIAKRLTKTPLSDGQYEANPLHSAPEIVAEVAKKHGVSENAATLYLQTLALFDCTTKNVREWNEWTAAEYNKAAKELVEAKLLLEAKRARAGRKHFLPGGWEALKAPHLPIESWKLTMYEIPKSNTGTTARPLDRIVCLKPCHELFADAWARIESGDEPSYEEVD